jgi:hypothetical protein
MRARPPHTPHESPEPRQRPARQTVARREARTLPVGPRTAASSMSPTRSPARSGRAGSRETVIHPARRDGSPLTRLAARATLSRTAQACPGKMLVQFLGVSPMLETIGDRLARPCAGYPRLHFRRQKTWMAGTSPAKTKNTAAIQPSRSQPAFPGQPCALREREGAGRVRAEGQAGVKRGCPDSRCCARHGRAMRRCACHLRAGFCR